jgi:GNAT superfamily N-acetyltransferase
LTVSADVTGPAEARMTAPRARRVEPGLVVQPGPFDGQVARALVAALMDDLDERYAADGPADGDHHEISGVWAVRGEQVTPPQGVFVVAYLGGQPVGGGAVRPLVEHAAGHLVPGPPECPGGATAIGEIKRMYTAPAARRRGVSRALLARLETEAVRLGYRRLQLETGDRQPEAIALYESAGYRRIPTYGQYEGDELSVCFAKDL